MSHESFTYLDKTLVLIRLPIVILLQSFITFMDALKLNLKAKDQLHPFLTELMTSYSRFKGSQEWEGRGKILHW
jgi:ESCRT-I complex subunit VPS28